MIKKNIRFLILTAIMLCASSGAWATTYYFWYKAGNDPQSGTMTRVGAMSASGSVNSQSVTFNGDYCFFITTSDSNTESTAYSSMITEESITSGTYNLSRGNYAGRSMFHLYYGSSVTVTVKYNSSTGSLVAESAASTYTVNASGSNCSFNESSRSGISSGGSCNFTVTPNSGYKLVSASLGDGTKGTITNPSGGTFPANTTSATTVTIGSITGNNTLTITTAEVEVVTNKPIVHAGQKPTVGGTCGINTYAYIAHRGCANITDVTLYYSNNRAFRKDGDYKTLTKNRNYTSGYPAINSIVSVDLTNTEVNKVVKPGETLYLRYTARNANGTSEYSDIVSLLYTCSQFVTQNLAKSFKACPGEHQFTWSDMFISPTPTTWSCTLGGSDATSDFTLKDGQMIWNTEGKSSTSYVYTFTGKKDGYADETATLTITYTVPDTNSGAVSSVTASPTSTKPWTAVSLTATGSKSNMTKIYWTCTPETASISPESAVPASSSTLTTATFKAESTGYSVDYTVTATGYTDKCAAKSASTTITVTPDATEKCD